MKNVSPPILISLKPAFADLIFQGLKTAELRRRASNDLRHREVYVYVSSPIRVLRGGFKVGEIWTGSPSENWKSVSSMAAISRESFDSYYQNSALAYALEIVEVWEYERPRGLQMLREQFPRFVVPQSYRYLRSNELRSFSRLKRTKKVTRKCLVA